MLRSIDREFFQLIGTAGANRHEWFKKLEEYGTNEPLILKSLATMEELLRDDFSDKVVTKVIDGMIEKSETDIVTDIIMVMDTLNLHPYIERCAVYGIEYYGIKKFEHALIYIMMLVDYSVLSQETVDLKTVICTCFPIGFYNEYACDIIIEKLIKTNSVEQAHVFHKAMEIKH